MSHKDIKEIDNLSIERIMGPVGIRPAMIGCRMSYQQGERSDSTNYRFGDRDMKLAVNLYKKGPSHSAFLRMIWFWIEIDAPLSFWIHFDKYKYVNRLDTEIEVRSESTMHTLLKEKQRRDRFTRETPKEVIDIVNRYIEKGDFKTAVDALPKGFKQKRMVNMNMQTLLSVIEQRKDHRLKEWKVFIEGMLETFPFLKVFVNIEDMEKRG